MSFFLFVEKQLFILIVVNLMSVPKVMSPRTYSSFLIAIFDLFSRFLFRFVDVKDAVPNSGRKKIYNLFFYVKNENEKKHFP